MYLDDIQPSRGLPILRISPQTTIDRYRIAAAEVAATARTMTVSEYAARYATVREISPGTARQYALTATLFERWAGRPVLLEELEELLVSAWLRDYAVDHAPDTVRSKRNGLLALWRAAADEYLCEPPTRRVRTARTPWTPREAWTVAQVSKRREGSDKMSDPRSAASLAAESDRGDQLHRSVDRRGLGSDHPARRPGSRDTR